MSHSVTIKEIATIFSPENGYSMSVLIEVFDGEKSLGDQRKGYPLDVTSEEIKADLRKYELSLDADKATGEASAALEAQMANVEKVRQELLSPSE